MFNPFKWFKGKARKKEEQEIMSYLAMKEELEKLNQTLIQMSEKLREEVEIYEQEW
jgi:hypothetical protein